MAQIIGGSAWKPRNLPDPWVKKGTGYVAPKPPQQKQITGGDGGATGGGYSYRPPQYPQYQAGFDWSKLIPQMPQTPVVTQQMIAEWLARAKQEAGLMFDPQKLGIQQELAKSLLGGQQAIAGLSPAYEEMIANIGEWKEEELAAEARRWFGRGLGYGGGLIEEERKIGETALKETTKAETEKARRIADIEEQGKLLTEQAAGKQTGLETSRGQYVASRQSELRDAYEANKASLNQQKFANQMQIAQFGMTAESQRYNQWLSQAEMANEQWYRQQTLGLQAESIRRGTAAERGMGAKDPYENMFEIPGGGYITYPEAISSGFIAEGQHAPQDLDAWILKQLEEGKITIEEFLGAMGD